MKRILFGALMILISFFLRAQSIGIGTTSPDNSAKLDISSTDKGMLVPRMTVAQRSAIIQPANGLIVYQTDGSSGFYYNSGTPESPAWLLLINSASAGTSGGILYGTGAGSSFTAAGISGNFLRSNGADAPSWGFLGQTVQTVYGTAGLNLSPTTTFTLIPGLTQSIVVPENSIVFITTNGGLSTTSTATTGFSVIDVVITINGIFPTNGGYQRVMAANTTGVIGVIANFSLSKTVQLIPGTYSIMVLAAGVVATGASIASVSGNSFTRLQGALSVVILKP